MSNDIQSPPEICGSPTLRMILNRIDGLPDAPASRTSSDPTTLAHDPSNASKIKILDYAHWDLAAWHPASWQGSLNEMHGPKSRLAIAFGGGFVIPLCLGLSFVSSMISGPPLAAKATQDIETVTEVVELQSKRVEAFASPDFFESAWTVLPVPTQLPARDVNRVEVVNGVVSPIAQIRVAVSTEPPVAPPANVAKPAAKAPAAVNTVKPAVEAVAPTQAPAAPTRQARQRLEAKTPLPVAPGAAVANANPPRAKAPSTSGTGESWASSWHRSALGMTQQKP
jgi:hypothetical protein